MFKLMQRWASPLSTSDVFLLRRCLSDAKPASDSSISVPESGVVTYANSSLAIQSRIALFEATKKDQLAQLVPRLEKIEIQYQGRGISNNALMFMNKHLSTPHHCAMHISKTVADSSVLAVITPVDLSNISVVQTPSTKDNKLVPSNQSDELPPQSFLWDMHRPLSCDCKLEILKFNMENSSPWHHEQVNRAYWNSCGFLLGAVMQEAFKQNYKIESYHFPNISEKQGAFCYDLSLDEKLKNWKPSEKDLVYFTKLARSLISKNLKFERLEVTSQLAFEMFQNDRFRTEKIQSIVDSNGDDAPIVLYRLGQYIDLSLGPHISSTSLMYHYVVVAFHKLRCSDADDVRRVQGISLPKDLRVQHTVWSMLENRARKLVKQDMKTTTTVDPSHADDDDATSIENKTKGYMLSTGQWKDGTWKATDQSFQIENTK